jgi:tRNA(fMet)-specific endonuclease VapC
MMHYVLDTNSVILLMAKRSEILVRTILGKNEGEIAIPSIVVHELHFGIRQSQKVHENRETLRLLLNDFPIIAFDEDDARISGEVRSELARVGTPIGPYDVLIAGQARARGLTVVTNNVREFNRVKNLTVEDWTKETP